MAKRERVIEARNVPEGIDFIGASEIKIARLGFSRIRRSGARAMMRELRDSVGNEAFARVMNMRKEDVDTSGDNNDPLVKFSLDKVLAFGIVEIDHEAQTEDQILELCEDHLNTKAVRWAATEILRFSDELPETPAERGNG